MVNFTLRSFIHGEVLPIYIGQEAGWAPKTVVTKRKIIHSAENRTPVVQHVAIPPAPHTHLHNSHRQEGTGTLDPFEAVMPRNSVCPHPELHEAVHLDRLIVAHLVNITVPCFYRTMFTRPYYFTPLITERFKVFTEVKSRSSGFVTSCNVMAGYQHFRGPCCEFWDYQSSDISSRGRLGLWRHVMLWQDTNVSEVHAVNFEAIKAVIFQVEVFWFVTPCNVAVVGRWCLHFRVRMEAARSSEMLIFYCNITQR
jgi:hypothetical protein